MKILQVEPCPDGGFLVTGRFRGRYALILLCVSVCFFCVAFGVHFLSDNHPETIRFMAFAVLVLLFAFSRWKYRIRPRVGIETRLTFLGMPILWTTIPEKEIMDYEVLEASNGSFILRFVNAAKQSRLVIEGFSSAGFADLVACAFRESENRMQKSVEAYVVMAKSESRAISPVLAVALVMVAFALCPLLLISFTDADHAFWYGAMGCLILLGALASVRPMTKIVRVAGNVMEGWMIHDCYRVAEYRHALGSDSGWFVTRIRFDRFVLLYPLMLGMQIAVIASVAKWDERRSEARRIQEEADDKQRLQNEELIQSPEVQAGIKRMKELMDKREKREAGQKAK